MRLHLAVCLSIFGTLAVNARAHAAANAPQVTFAADSITATAVTPHGQVLFVGVALEPQGYYSKTTEWYQVIAETAGAGTATLPLGRAVPWKSLWFVCDLTSHQYTIAAPPGYPIRRLRAAQNPLRRGPSSAVDRVVHPHAFVNAVYVEPNGNAFAVDARDGYDTDGDGVPDGITTVSLSSMKTLAGTSAPPREFTPAGVLILLDPMQLDVLELPLDAALLAGAR